MTERWLTPAEIAEWLQISTEKVYGAIRAGELKSKRFGRLYRVRPEWYAAWCEGRPDGAVVEDEPVVRATPGRTPAVTGRGGVQRLVDVAAIRAARAGQTVGRQGNGAATR